MMIRRLVVSIVGNARDDIPERVRESLVLDKADKRCGHSSQTDASGKPLALKKTHLG